MQIRLWDVNLKVRLFGEGLFNLLFWMYFPFITIYFSEELGSSLAGLLMMVPPICGLFASLLGGALADHFGRRRVMLMGAFIQTLSFSVFALSPSPWLDYFEFILIGIGGAIYRPASSAMVADLVPSEKLREVFATFTTANNIGAVLGPALGAVFFFHYKQPFLWICALVTFLYFIAIFTFVKETWFRPKIIEKRSTIGSVMSQQWSGYGVIFRDKIFLLYTVAGIFALVPIMQLDLYLPVYIINHIPSQPLIPGMQTLMLSSTDVFGWLIGFNGLLFVIFILPVTKWFGWWKERNVFILSSLLAGIGTFMVGLNDHIWYLFFVTIIFTFGELVRSPVTQSFISRYAPADKRGQYMGADSLQPTIGKFLAPMTVFLSNWLSPMSVFSLILLFSLISVVLYLQLFRMYDGKGVAKG